MSCYVNGWLSNHQSITPVIHLALRVGVKCIKDEIKGRMKKSCVRVKANVIV